MFAPGASIIIPPMVSVYTKGIGWVTEAYAVAAPSSAAYEALGRAAYFPILLPSSCIVKRVWWANGATTTGGATIEVGVYSDTGSYSPGSLLVSGSAVQGTATEVQFVDVTDTALPPGLYWIAISSSTATNTTLMWTSIGNAAIDAGSRYQQASASPLPATATPVETTTSLVVYLCGFSTTASP